MPPVSPPRLQPAAAISSESISTVLDLPLAKAAEKLGVKRTALKKAYRRRCPGLPWPGTPGVTKPQIRPDVRHAQAIAASGLTHHQQLEQLLARRAVPSKSVASRIPLRASIEECGEPSELDTAPWVAARPGSRPDAGDGRRSSESAGSAAASEEHVDMSVDGVVSIPDFLMADATESAIESETQDAVNAAAAEGESAPVLPEPMPREVAPEEWNQEEPRGDPKELPWGGPSASTSHRAPPRAVASSPVLEMAGLKAVLPLQRVLKGSAQAAGRMTLCADGPFERSLLDPRLHVDKIGQHASSCAASSTTARSLGGSVEVTVNLLVQTVSRRELHRRDKQAVSVLKTGRPALPTIVSKSETSSVVVAAPMAAEAEAPSLSASAAAAAAAGGTAAAAVGTRRVTHHTWEQLSLWCLSLVTDIELVLWIDSGGSQEQQPMRVLYHPAAVQSQQQAEQFVQIVESTPAWSEVQQRARAGKSQAQTISKEVHAAAVAAVAKHKPTQASSSSSATENRDPKSKHQAKTQRSAAAVAAEARKLPQEQRAVTGGLGVLAFPWLDYAGNIIGIVGGAYRYVDYEDPPTYLPST